jgi:hypothetical protein
VSRYHLSVTRNSKFQDPTVRHRLMNIFYRNRNRQTWLGAKFTGLGRLGSGTQPLRDLAWQRLVYNMYFGWQIASEQLHCTSLRYFQSCAHPSLNPPIHLLHQALGTVQDTGNRRTKPACLQIGPATSAKDTPSVSHQLAASISC